MIPGPPSSSGGEGKGREGRRGRGKGREGGTGKIGKGGEGRDGKGQGREGGREGRNGGLGRGGALRPPRDKLWIRPYFQMRVPATYTYQMCEIKVAPFFDPSLHVRYHSN